MLKAGFSRVDITAPLGIFVDGYYIDRFADGVLDPLEANCVAVSDGTATVAIITLDSLGGTQPVMDAFRQAVAKETGLPYEAVYIASTHTHLAPSIEPDKGEALYNEYLSRQIVSAVRMAIDDLSDCKVSIGRGCAPGISFVRRFRMKNGDVATNPGIGNPDIAEVLGTPDEETQLTVLAREDKEDILLVHFQVHPDVIGGCKYSADYPGFVRRTLEQSLPGVKAVYLNGAQGDTNHVNVFATEADKKGMHWDFDDVMRGYDHAAYMGRVIAGSILQIYGKTEDLPDGEVFFGQTTVKVPSAMPTKEELEEAVKINDLHEAGKDEDIPFTGMALTTVVAEAARMVRLANGPESFDVYVTSVGFGDIALLGIAGEPFTEVGRILKRESPFAMTIPTCLTNGSEGYYPMQSAYEEGGYEARSSQFKPGVAELIAKTGVELLQKLHR